MAWVPSHQELRDHPKTRRAARKAGVSIPSMIGHLHLLWWWALDHATDEGDVSRFDAEDLADAAAWDGDPAVFVTALKECGPGGSNGFLTVDNRLHDWAEYGGVYQRKSAAGKKAAKARWANKQSSDQEEHAIALRPHSEPISDRNAEKRREEKITPPPPPETTDCDRNATASEEDPRVSRALDLLAQRRAPNRPSTSRYVQRIAEKLRSEEAVDIDAARLCADYPDAPADLIAAALAGEDARNLAHFRPTADDPPPPADKSAALAHVRQLRQETA